MSAKFNPDLIEARIREINDSIALFQSLIAKDFKNLVETEKLALRYLVIQLVEASAGICIHIFATMFGEKPSGFPDCFTRLGKKGIIPEELASSLSSASRLRNLLVHRYWQIKDKLVYESLKAGKQDFIDFLQVIRKLVDNEEGK